LTNHAHVLICISNDEAVRLKDLAQEVGITERAVQRIVADLEEAGYLSHSKEGRRNVYRVRPKQHLRHPIERHNTVEVLLRLGKAS
jgi:DNA-binding MarR family transcriptional regulator